MSNSRTFHISRQKVAEKEGSTMTDTITIDGVKCICTDNCITIRRSYLIDSKDAFHFCLKLKAATKNRYKRSEESWAAELVAHNMLYSANMFKAHVVDTELEEHEKLHRRIAYRLIYCGYKILTHSNNKEED